MPILVVCCCLLGIVGMLATLASSFVFKPAISKRSDAFLVAEIEHELTLRLALDGGTAAGVALGPNIRDLIPTDTRQLHVIDPAGFRSAVRAARQANEEEVNALELTNDNLRPMVHYMYGQRLEALLREMRLLSGTGAALFVLSMLLVVWPARDPTSFSMAGRWTVAATWLGLICYAISRDWAWTLLTADFLGEVVLVGGVLVVLSALDIGFNQARVTIFLVEMLRFI